MVLAVQEFFYVVVLAVGFVFAGRILKDSTTGIIGGFISMIVGLAILVEPVTGFSDLLNWTFGLFLIGFGAYITIVGSLEAIKD